jgi:hypothetical protein
VPITPDDKDWTWVLTRPCQECGFDTAAVVPAEVGAMIRANAATWRTVLGRPDAAERPIDEVWSPLEYGCHVRDVYRLYDHRLGLMLTEDGPTYANWDQDETAIAEGYADQRPEIVADELVEAGASLADRFNTVTGPAWERTGTRSDGAHFTVDSFARYLLHDVVHHLHDVGVR